MSNEKAATIVDPRHPLFGRTFPLLGISTKQYLGVCCVVLLHKDVDNDRLLLGLKGTMSEAELHLLRQRLEAGRMSQVRRAEYRQHLPTGLIRLPDGKMVKDPDEQVRQTIELLFEKFVQLGSCNKVLRYMRKEKILLPRNQRSG